MHRGDDRVSVNCERPVVSPIPASTGVGTWTPHLLRRTGLVYIAICILGILPLPLGGPAWLQAAGIGLWWPGAGFIAVGGWSALLILPAMLSMALAVFAWFGAGMVIAPVVVWIGSAFTAGALAGSAVWTPSPYVVASITAVSALMMRLHLRKQGRLQIAKREQRNSYLAEEMAQVAKRQAETADRQPMPKDDELHPDQLAALRYALDRALQPIDDFSGFDSIDQFQTSALRYQINQLGWALGVAQGRYTPSFHGYLSDAQRRLIDRYLQSRVLSYWKWESLWGHLNTDPDPIGRDNIMLTGFLGINLGLYMGNTGDRRYMAPGSLEFHVGERRIYRHSAATVRESLLANYRRYHTGLCLYPCEPTWVYTACNLRGAATLASFDRAFGTEDWPTLRQHFLQRLESDFMTQDGSMIALRSNATGITLPFPMPDAVLAKELNPVFPELAHRYWAIVRRESLERRDGRWSVTVPTKNVDFGNYTSDDIAVLYYLFGAAREMGDDEIADTLLEVIDAGERRTLRDGVLYFEGVSTLMNATIVTDRLLRCNGWRDAINRPLPETIFRGPLLAEARYPEVLVAKAYSDGNDLHLVLYPGREPGSRTLRIERLKPRGAYRVRGGTPERMVANDEGAANVTVNLQGRHELYLAPEP
jgi:hypothetical protein